MVFEEYYLAMIETVRFSEEYFQQLVETVPQKLWKKAKGDPTWHKHSVPNEVVSSSPAL